jgi:hypothetical protein
MAVSVACHAPCRNQDKRPNNERPLAFKRAVRDLANTGIVRDETKRGKFVLCTT